MIGYEISNANGIMDAPLITELILNKSAVLNLSPKAPIKRRPISVPIPINDIIIAPCSLVKPESVMIRGKCVNGGEYANEKQKLCGTYYIYIYI